MDKAAEQRIWQTVAQIPPGRVASYGQIARLALLPGYARFVGRVLARLPSGSTLPWHRVLRADGQIAFPPGSAARASQVDRLQSEGVEVRQGRVPMRRYAWPADTP